MSLINREALLSFEEMDAELCATCGEHHMVARIEKNGWVNPMTEQYISEVTHWMQMPNPPKGE